MKKSMLEETVSELEDTINSLEWIIQQKKNRIVELIAENDRLTLTYEPYEPPKEKKEKKKKLPKWGGTVSFDFWPISDWVRLSYKPYKSGKYAQICIGPLRIDWFAN